MPGRRTRCGGQQCRTGASPLRHRAPPVRPQPGCAGAPSRCLSRSSPNAERALPNASHSRPLVLHARLWCGGPNSQQCSGIADRTPRIIVTARPANWSNPTGRNDDCLVDLTSPAGRIATISAIAVWPRLSLRTVLARAGYATWTTCRDCYQNYKC